MKKVFERVKDIFLKPRETWENISTEDSTIPELYRNYFILVAAVPVVASFIGRSLVGIYVPYSFRVVRLSFFGSLTVLICEYIFFLGSAWALGKAISFLAPRFDSESDDVKGVQIAMYTLTPFLAAGVLNLIPSLATLVILIGLYGLYLLYVGLPIVMVTPKEKAKNYAIVSILAALILAVLLWIIDRTLLSLIGPNI